MTLPALIELRLLDLGLDRAPGLSPLPALRELHLRTQRASPRCPEAVRALRELRAARPAREPR